MGGKKRNTGSKQGAPVRSNHEDGSSEEEEAPNAPGNSAAPKAASGAAAPLSFNFNFGSFNPAGAGAGAAGAAPANSNASGGAGGGAVPFRFSFPSNAVSVNHASDDDEGDEDDNEDGENDDDDDDDMASSMLRRLLGNSNEGMVGDYPSVESSMDSEAHRVQLAAAAMVEKRIEQLYMRMQGELCDIEREEYAQAAPLLAKRSDFATARTKATPADMQGHQLLMEVGAREDGEHADPAKTNFWARTIFQLFQMACARAMVLEDLEVDPTSIGQHFEVHFLSYLTDVQYEPLAPTTPAFTELDLDAKFVFHFAPNPYMMDPSITVVYRPIREFFRFSPSAIRWKRSAPHSMPPVNFMSEHSSCFLLQTLFGEHNSETVAEEEDSYNVWDVATVEFYHMLRTNFLTLFRSVYYGLDLSKLLLSSMDDDEDDDEFMDDEDDEDEDEDEDEDD